MNIQDIQSVAEKRGYIVAHTREGKDLQLLVTKLRSETDALLLTHEGKGGVSQWRVDGEGHIALITAWSDNGTVWETIDEPSFNLNSCRAFNAGEELANPPRVRRNEPSLTEQLNARFAVVDSFVFRNKTYTKDYCPYPHQFIYKSGDGLSVVTVLTHPEWSVRLDEKVPLYQEISETIGISPDGLLGGKGITAGGFLR